MRSVRCTHPAFVDARDALHFCPFFSPLFLFYSSDVSLLFLSFSFFFVLSYCFTTKERFFRWGYTLRLVYLTRRSTREIGTGRWMIIGFWFEENFFFSLIVSRKS